MAEATVAKKRQSRSVQKTLTYESSPQGQLILSLASIADDFPPWGGDPIGLDYKLREFWPTESYIQSAIFSVATRNCAFSWTLQGGSRTVAAYREMLLDNWLEVMYRWNIDYLTQNNGAFIEIIREGKGPDSPCVGIAHLDAARCRRTGVPEWPVIYSDIMGIEHKLAPWQVYAMSDMPSPIETMNGVGMCAVYRVLREAQRMRDISIHDREKLSGFNPKGLFILGNVGTKQIEQVLQQHKEIQLQKGYIRYVKPAVVGVLDPTKPASVAAVDFASLPDGFNKDVELTWYITVLALALGCDYQDLAPLSSGSLGTSSQSQVLHLKSKGKGPAMFMKRFSHMMNQSGILPATLEFEFDEKDIQDEQEEEALALAKAQTRSTYITAGVLTPMAVRMEMLDDGEISQEQFDAMAKEDVERKAQEEEERQVRMAGLQAKVQEGDQAAPGGDIEGPKTGDEAGAEKGGEGSGHFGHEGRPGEVGGGLPEGQTHGSLTEARNRGEAGSTRLAREDSDPKLYDPDRSKRAKAAYKRSGKLVQRKADKHQEAFAKAIGGENTEDNAEFDVIKGKKAVEFKTIIHMGPNNKLTVHPPSRRDKEAFAKAHNLSMHMVAIDTRPGMNNQMYYKEGVGAYRLETMRKVTMADLEEVFK
jgi:hypothetical protein